MWNFLLTDKMSSDGLPDNTNFSIEILFFVIGIISVLALLIFITVKATNIITQKLDKKNNDRKSE